MFSDYNDYYIFNKESSIYDDSEPFFGLSDEDRIFNNMRSSFSSHIFQSKLSLSESDSESMSVPVSVPVSDEDEVDDNNSNSNSSCTIRSKRGRKNNITEAQHTKSKNDCRMSKIQANYFTFLILFLNFIMKKLNLRYQFFKLKGESTSKVNQKYRASLNKKTIKEILESIPISPKYKKEENNNVNIINKLIQEGQDTLLNILEKNVLYFFEKIYFANKRKFNLSQFGLKSFEVELPQNIQLFKDLLNKSKNDENFCEYRIKMEKCAKKYFFLNEKDLSENISIRI